MKLARTSERNPTVNSARPANDTPLLSRLKPKKPMPNPPRMYPPTFNQSSHFIGARCNTIYLEAQSDASRVKNFAHIAPQRRDWTLPLTVFRGHMKGAGPKHERETIIRFDEESDKPVVGVHLRRFSKSSDELERIARIPGQHKVDPVYGGRGSNVGGKSWGRIRFERPAKKGATQRYHHYRPWVQIPA
jgi:hypothetical protein